MKYNGVPPVGEIHNLPSKLSLTYLDEDYKKDAMKSTLGSLDYNNLQYRNYYVAYGAIDLMNYVFSNLNETTVLYNSFN